MQPLGNTGFKFANTMPTHLPHAHTHRHRSDYKAKKQAIYCKLLDRAQSKGYLPSKEVLRGYIYRFRSKSPTAKVPDHPGPQNQLIQGLFLLPAAVSLLCNLATPYKRSRTGVISSIQVQNLQQHCKSDHFTPHQPGSGRANVLHHGANSKLTPPVLAPPPVLEHSVSFTTTCPPPL